MTAPKPESRFRNNRVRPFLKELQRTAYFAIQQKSISGDPDYMLCIRGQFVALELKTDVGKLSKLQEYKLHKVEEAGGWSIVARPGNWEAVEALLLDMSIGEVNDRVYVWDGFEPGFRQCAADADPHAAAD